MIEDIHNKIQELEQKRKKLDEEIDTELWDMKKQILEMERKLNELREHYDKTRGELRKQKISPIDKELHILKSKLKDEIKKENERKFMEFKNEIRKHIGKMYKIREISIPQYEMAEKTVALGHVELTNFIPYNREVIEITPSDGFGFKYKILWKEGKKHGKITENRINVGGGGIYGRAPEWCEVVLEKDGKEKVLRFVALKYSDVDRGKRFSAEIIQS